MKLDNHSLYYFDTCPFCVRVLMAMEQLGISMELKNIYQGAENLKELRDGGGSTMVPCLRIESDAGTQWMYESLDIIDYLKGKVSPN